MREASVKVARGRTEISSFHCVRAARSKLAVIKNRLQVRAKGQQTAIAVLYYELSRAPWHVGKPSRELHALGRVLALKRVRAFDIEVCVKQLVLIFFRSGGGRHCAAEVNCVLVACHNGVYRRILPRAQTFEAKLLFVIGDCSENVISQELRCDLTNHATSVPYRLAAHSAVGNKRKIKSTNLDPQASAEPPGGIVRFRAIVIHENSVVAAITKEGAAEFSDIRRCFYPARGFRIEFAKLLQLSILFLC